MSRIRRATVAASFTYVQYALVIVSGIVLVPLMLHDLGARTYGLWLATGELLAYVGMVDLGVLGVLPWMIAEADGRGDRDRIRTLVANGCAVGAGVGVGYALLAWILWTTVPSALTLSAADRQAVGPPLLLLVLATMVAYPLRVFSALIAGLQDVAFNGWLTVSQHLLAIVVTLSLLLNGHGLYALACGTAAASMLTVVGAFVRATRIAPDLLRSWPRPSIAAARTLLSNGAGVWFGALGWQLAASSNGLVMTALGRAEWVAVWACTSKLTSTATQLSWVVPDAGLVGLAQVHGEGRGPSRVRSLVLTLLRIHVLLAGGAACGLLAFNPAFVTRWVGADLFGGLALNTVLALGIVVNSTVHGLLTAASVVGRRVLAGVVTLALGGLQVVMAWWLGARWGLPGIAAASVLCGLVIAVPGGAALLRSAAHVTLRDLWDELVRPWAAHAAPVVMLGITCGLFYRELGLLGSLAATSAVGMTYVWAMRPFYAGLPLDHRMTRALAALRLLPRPPAPMERAS